MNTMHPIHKERLQRIDSQLGLMPDGNITPQLHGPCSCP